MASDSNHEELQSTSEVQERMGDAHSKDLEHSNSSQIELSPDKPSSTTVLEPSSTSSTPALESSDNTRANILESPPDDSVSQFSENELIVTASVSDETSEIGETSTEHLNVASVTNSNDLPLSDENNETQSDLSDCEENKSSEVMQSIISAETIMNKVIHSALSEETDTTRVIQPALSQETQSSEIIQPVLSEVTESTGVVHSLLRGETHIMQTQISEETSSSAAIQKSLSDKMESDEIIQPDHSNETVITKVIDPVISEGIDSNKEIPSDILESSCNKKAMSSHDSENNGIASNDTINPSAFPVIPPGTAADLSSDEENSGSFPPALDLDSFLSLLNTEEYKNASHFAVPGGHVIVTPTTPKCEPIFPDLIMPPLSSPTKNPSMEPFEHSNPAKDRKDIEDLGSKRSLYTLLSMFIDWVQRGMKNVFGSLEEPKILDVMDYFKSDLKCRLDLLKQMNKRIDALLRAVDGLPDPAPILSCEMRGKKISNRDGVKIAGVNIQRRLEVLEADATEDYNKFDSICSKVEKLYPDEFDAEKTAKEAHEILCNSLVNVSEYFLTLGMDIQNFRDRIRDFCLEMDRAMTHS